MRSRFLQLLAGAWALLMTTPVDGAAQTLSLNVHEGTVSMVAVNVPLRDILALWAQLTGGSIVNGEYLPAGPVSLTLNGVTEREAFATLLRDASGYILTMRPERHGATGSSFERILVAPFASAAAGASLARPAPQRGPAVARAVAPADPDAGDSVPPADVAAVPPPVADGVPASSPTPRPVASGPFGGPFGAAQPGMITPVPAETSGTQIVPPRPPGPTQSDDLPPEARDLLPR